MTTKTGNRKPQQNYRTGTVSNELLCGLKTQDLIIKAVTTKILFLSVLSICLDCALYCQMAAKGKRSKKDVRTMYIFHFTGSSLCLPNGHT